MKYTKITLLAACFLIPVGTPLSLAAEDRLTFKSIDFPQATMTQAWGISARGEIVGWYSNADASQHGFRLNGEQYTAIDFPGATSTLAFGVNSRGDVVGVYVTAGVTHGFLLSGNRFTTIDYPGAERTDAAGINARGDIVGLQVTGGVPHGFLLRGSEFTSIDYAGATSTVGNGLNDRGDIVGNYAIAGVTRGFVLRDGKFTSIEYKDAGFTGAFGISTAGEIIGRYRDAAGAFHAYLLSDGKFTAVDFPGATLTSGNAIASTGDIVGRYILNGANRSYLLSRLQQKRFTVTDLGSLGGSIANALGVNNAGVVTGGASVPGGDLHPFLWRKGGLTDLGTLGGANGVATNANGANQVSVVTETLKIDPLGQDFCGFGSHRVCLAAVWQDGKLTALPTLGGNNAIGFGMNERGQIAGVAEKTTRDSSCPAPQALAFAPVIWGANGSVQELGMPAGDTVGFAIGINERGDAVGSTGTCADTTVAAAGLVVGSHAILWQNGVPTNLGTLGAGSLAVAINNRGEVVGGSVLSDHSGIHGFLWSREEWGLTEISPVAPDASSLPTMINDARQVVGGSCDHEFNCRAFLWERNVVTDLNELIPPDSPLHLIFASWISDAGEIVGQAVDKKSGELRAFLASPVAADKKVADQAATSKAISPDIRNLLQRRLQDGQLAIPQMPYPVGRRR